jgi:hypothetical protein
MKKGQGRKHLINRLMDIVEEMMVGSRSVTYERCQRKGCSCQKGELHGPHLSMVWKRGDGKTTGVYIRKGYEDKANSGIEAWKDYKEIGKVIANINRQEFIKEMMRKGGWKDGKRAKG